MPQFLVVSQLPRDLGHLAPGRQFQVTQPAHGGGAHAQRQQVFLAVTTPATENPELHQRFRVAALPQPLPLGVAPQRFSGGGILADRGAHPPQQLQRQGEIASAILPKRRRADTDVAGQFAGGASTKLQPRDELFQRVAGSGVETAQFLKMLGGHFRTLVESEELLQDPPRRCVNAQFQIAQGSAADAGATSQFQARQTQKFGANGDQDASQGRRRLRAAHGTFTQMSVAQGVALQRVGRMVRVERHEAPLA